MYFQEYEDKKVEAAQQDKGIKNKGDSQSLAKVRHEPFSFDDGELQLLYNDTILKNYVFVIFFVYLIVAHHLDRFLPET